MSPDKSNQDDRFDSPDEERLGQLINEFFDRRERGEALSEEAFLAEHPQYADELRQHLVGLQLLEGIGSSSQMELIPGDETEVAPGSSGRRPLTNHDGPLPVIPGYDISKLLGRGGMGVVYKAIQRSTRREVALKLLLEGPLATEQSRKRFEREVSLAAQLRHPNIIPIYDSGKHDGRMYYAMEYVRGLPLLDHLKERALDVRGKLSLFVKICAAVKHAHLRGVVHRDIKPTNVLVRADGEPQILDFGLAKAGAHTDMTTSLTAQIVGTPAYMSPEQAAGDPAAIDSRTDIYSLGVMLYEMLTGAMPYETRVPMGRLLENIARADPRPPRQFDSRIDSELTAILMKALEKGADDRYQSVDALSDDIVRYLREEPISVRPPSTVYLVRKLVRRHRTPVAAISACVIIAAASFAIFSALTARKEREIQETITQKEQIQNLAQDLQRERDLVQSQRDELNFLLDMFPPETREEMKKVAQAVGALTTPEERLMLLHKILKVEVNPEFIAATEPRPKDTRDLYDEPMATALPQVSVDSSPPPKPPLAAQVLARLQTMITPPPAKPQEATSRPADDPTRPDRAIAEVDRSSPTSAPSS